MKVYYSKDYRGWQIFATNRRRGGEIIYRGEKYKNGELQYLFEDTIDELLLTIDLHNSKAIRSAIELELVTEQNRMWRRANE